MSAYQELTFPRVDIGGGLWATNAWVRRGPIVLVNTIDATGGAERKSRLDLQKVMFIDPLPGERNDDGVRHLVQSVMSASR